MIFTRSFSHRVLFVFVNSYSALIMQQCSKSCLLIINYQFLIMICVLWLLCSFIDLPNLSSSIYSTELHNRLRSFLVSCPPAGPSPPVVELVIATADFQRDLALWNIRCEIGCFIYFLYSPLFIFYLHDGFLQSGQRWSWCKGVVSLIYNCLDPGEASFNAWIVQAW